MEENLKSEIIESENLTKIGRGTRFKGEIITSSGNVEIHGEYEGNIQAETVKISEGGYADGFFDCNTFIVNPNGKAVGEVYTKNIRMTNGSVFDGKIRMKRGKL